MASGLSELTVKFGKNANEVLDFPLKLVNQRAFLFKQIEDYVNDLLRNGILQHSLEWEKVKVFTVGGSQISTIIRCNPYSSIQDMIGQKIGLSKFKDNINVQWGNLFEEVIQRYVEWDRRTKIIGCDIYIPGPPGTSYSPDGLGVVNMMYEYVDKQTGQLIMIPLNKRVLFEFKCPFSRIPNGVVPKYYVPQVQYGLDIIPCVDIGMFVEGVFRRSSWEDLGFNPRYDTQLTAKPAGVLPLSYGIIGFYMDVKGFDELLDSNAIKVGAGQSVKYSPMELARQREKINKLYCAEFEIGDETNSYMTNDLGTTGKYLFEAIMQGVQMGILKVWYGRSIFTGNRNDTTAPKFVEAVANESINADLATYEALCKTGDYLNYGILPWKLLRVDYHVIEKSPGFVEKHLPAITEVIDVVKECLAPENAGKKLNIFNSYIQKTLGGGFDE